MAVQEAELTTQEAESVLSPVGSLTFIRVIDAHYMDNIGTIQAIIIVEFDGIESEVPYVTNPTDPYSLSPAIRQWFLDNPEFVIGPYVPPPEPTPEELRALMPALPRLTFRNRFKAAGMTTAVINNAIAAIEDESEQEDMQIAWEDTQSFGRLDPFVIMVATFAGKTSAQIDTIWTA
ncbi:hypothetical protein [Pararhizobium sp. DWP1-1-3]|uniref:hypothetical protein n=1 Tax=Pararhizobium sp. DWP1-1-3 TaxID=2804652 RepID=UPI003CF61431